jgi:hypothetical protein
MRRTSPLAIRGTSERGRTAHPVHAFELNTRAMWQPSNRSVSAPAIHDDVA